ncbi:hypothetical protein Fmac_029003 [Flemingia macrophylla]|uniref:Uncharacterized protein n=1 Tax=Flemingia macrophylla TaxID=520843 RepID=A0ABD1L938_9FABA
MKFEEARNNLRATRLLYRLLEDNSLALQNSYSKDLVETARAILKKLLDVAVESVFETHLKTIDTEAGVSKTSSEQEKDVVVQESKSLVSANISQSSVKYPPCSEMTPEKEEQLKLLSKKELPELSKFSISEDGGTKCKTLCNIGEESSMMQQSTVKATNLSNDNGALPKKESSHNKQQHNDVNALYGDGERAKESLRMFDAKDSEQYEANNISLLNRIHEAQSNSNAARKVEYLDQKGDFSDDLVNVIKRIESQILAFKLCSNSMDSTSSGAGHHTTHETANSDSPVIQRKNGASGSLLSCGTSLFEGHRLVTHTDAESAKSIDVSKQIGTQMISRGEWLRSQKRIQSSEQNIAIIDRVKSLNRLVSGDTYFGSQASECIQGLRVPLNQDGHTKKNSMLASKTNRESMVRESPVSWSKTDQNWKEMRSESSYAHKSAGSKSIIARREKPPPHHMVIKPTLLDQRFSEIKVNSRQHRDYSVFDKRRTNMTGHLEPQKRRVLPEHHEPEESSSNSDSSRWSSQQGSANGSCDSEDYSLQDGRQCPPSGRIVDAAYENSSEESKNSYLDKDYGPSPRFGGFKSYRHHRDRNSKETIGKLRRLKNKLGLIFHHHHHHHHHHDDGHGKTHSREGHRHGLWNHLHSVFYHKDKHGASTKKVEKTTRTQRNQVGQFHRLAEGVLRHIQHSKKPKPDGVKQSRNTPHGPRQKKLLWWQIFRRHHQVKLKNKGRVKVGFKNTKSLKNY